MSLTYVPVHCYMTPEQLTSPFPSVDDFTDRLLEAVSRRLQGNVTLADVGKVIVPPYLAFVSFAEKIRRAGVEVVTNGDAIEAGCMPVTGDVLAVPWESGPSLKATIKEACIPGNPLLLEFIPNHPSYGKRHIDPKFPIRPVDFPLYPCADPAMDLQHKQLIHVKVPTPLGRYDVDEIQLRVMRDMKRCVPEVAGYVAEQLQESLANKDLEQRFERFQAKAKEITPRETTQIPDIDPIPAQELIGQLNNFSLQLHLFSEETKRTSAAIDDLWTPRELQVYLHLQSPEPGLTKVVITSAHFTPLSNLTLDTFQLPTGDYISSQEILDLLPGENREVFPLERGYHYRLTLRETGQALEV